MSTPPAKGAVAADGDEEDAVEPALARPAFRWEVRGVGADRGNEVSDEHLSGLGARPEDVAATPAAPAGWTPRWGTVRFWASFAWLCTLAVVIELGLVPLAAYARCQGAPAAELLVGALTLAVAVYLFEWASLYGNSLHTAHRAYFDEPNVRLTYQPRRRTMGHLFQPEPPTPGPSEEQRASAEAECLAHMTEADAADHERVKQHADARAAFNTARDAHYRNEFQMAMRAARQMNLDEMAADTSDSADAEGAGATAPAPAAGRRGDSDRKKAGRQRSKEGSRSRSGSRGKGGAAEPRRRQRGDKKQ